MSINFNIQDLKSSQKAIIELIYLTPEELSADQIFLQLNQTHKSYSYACVYNNIRILREQNLLIVTPQNQRKSPSRYQLTAHLEKHITQQERYIKK